MVSATRPLPEGGNDLNLSLIHILHQALEAFIHNMNTIHRRGGNQVVFSSINYGTDTSAEGRCIMRAILQSTYQGVGNEMCIRDSCLP